MKSIILPGKFYYIDDLYEENNFININETFNDINEVVYNKQFEESKEPVNLFGVLPKIKSFIENDNFNNSNIYCNQITKTNYNIKQNSELIFHVFKNIEKSNIIETKKSTNEPSFVNDIKMNEMSNDINNNNQKKDITQKIWVGKEKMNFKMKTTKK